MQKGEKIKIDPIKSLKNIQTIKKLLADKPRDLALFVMGINRNLRASDLLNLKAGQVKNLKPMDEIEINEKKTKKARRISLNKACIEAIQGRLASKVFLDSDPLFRGRGNELLTVPSVNRLVKGWCKAINLKGDYGSHSLRKTWGTSRGHNSTWASPS